MSHSTLSLGPGNTFSRCEVNLKVRMLLLHTALCPEENQTEPVMAFPYPQRPLNTEGDEADAAGDC